MSAKKPHPCKCGCGLETGHRHRRWVSGHMPANYRANLWAQTRHRYAYKRRALLFKKELDRLGTRFTREDLVVVLNDVRKRGYQSGFLKGQNHARQRVGEHNTMTGAVAINR